MIGASRTAALPGLAASRTAALPGLAVSRTSTCSLESAFMPLRVHSAPHSCLYVLTRLRIHASTCSLDSAFTLRAHSSPLRAHSSPLRAHSGPLRAHSGRKVRAPVLTQAGRFVSTYSLRPEGSCPRAHSGGLPAQGLIPPGVARPGGLMPPEVPGPGRLIPPGVPRPGRLIPPEVPGPGRLIPPGVPFRGRLLLLRFVLLPENKPTYTIDIPNTTAIDNRKT